MSFPYDSQDAAWGESDSALEVAQQAFDGKKAIASTETLATVREWMKVSCKRTTLYRDYACERADSMQVLLKKEVEAYREMLDAISKRIYPSHERTLFDDGSLATRATGIRSNNPILSTLRGHLDPLRLNVAVLADWYRWSTNPGTSLNSDGMFDAIREQHILTRAIADGLGEVSADLNKLLTIVQPRAEEN